MRRSLVALRNIRVRLVLWYVLLVIVALAIFSAALYIGLRQSLLSHEDQEIARTASHIAADMNWDVRSGASPATWISASGNDFLLQGLLGQDVLDTLLANGFAIRMLDPEGSAVGGVGPYTIVLANMEPLDNHYSSTSVLKKHWRLYSTKVFLPNGDEAFLQVGRPMDLIDSTLSRLLFLELAIIPAFLVVAVAGGLFMARRSLKPIERIIGVAAGIEAMDLSKRVNLGLPDDEVGKLASIFDRMFSRLQNAFNAQQDFVSEAAHELRTPLTVMKGTTEVALRRDRSPGEYRETLLELKNEIDYLVAISEDLLDLSHTDYENPSFDLASVELAEVVRSAADIIRPLAERRDIAVEVKADELPIINGDAKKLTRMFLNLLDNAVEYSPPGSRVTFTLDRTRRQVIASVRDNGPGIPAGSLEEIFRPFNRLEEGRESNPSGSGLGLAIALWIARAHGGDIEVESELGHGTTFTVVLPVS